MRFISVSACVVFFVLAPMCLSVFAQNLFVNPSFEEPVITGDFAFSTVPGWIITGAQTTEVQRGLGGVVAAHGKQWLELDASGNTTVSQDVATVVGQRYRI